MHMEKRKVLLISLVSCIILLGVISLWLVSLMDEGSSFGTMPSSSADGASAQASLSSKQLTKVTYRTSDMPYIDAAPVIIAQENGYYAEEGLSVELLPGQGSVFSVQAVGSGEDFSEAAANVVLPAVAKGVPVKVVAVILRDSDSTLFFPANSSIRLPKDLEGKTFATELKGTTHQEFLIFAKLTGIDVNKVELFPVASAAQKLQTVLSGKADFTVGVAYIVGPLFEAQGAKMRSIVIKDYGEKFYGQSIITNDKMISEHPEVVRGFTKATLKGFAYMIDHPDEAVDALVTRYPEISPQRARAGLERILPYLQSEETQQHGLGYQSKERWEEMQDLLYDNGFMDRKIDVTTAYTLNFLPQ